MQFLSENIFLIFLLPNFSEILKVFAKFRVFYLALAAD